ncbi:MAG: hypothetical protein V4546_16405 [Bacteroidota bacterium]
MEKNKKQLDDNLLLINKQRKNPTDKTIILDNQKVLPVKIPSNIDLEMLLQEHPLDIPYPKDNILFMLSVIQFDNKSPNNYTLIFSSRMQAISRGYNQVLLWLQARGILEIKNYEYKTMPRRCRFEPQYHIRFKTEYIKKTTLINKMVRYKFAPDNDK